MGPFSKAVDEQNFAGALLNSSAAFAMLQHAVTAGNQHADI